MSSPVADTPKPPQSPVRSPQLNPPSTSQSNAGALTNDSLAGLTSSPLFPSSSTAGPTPRSPKTPSEPITPPGDQKPLSQRTPNKSLQQPRAHGQKLEPPFSPRSTSFNASPTPQMIASFSTPTHPSRQRPLYSNALPLLPSRFTSSQSPNPRGEPSTQLQRSLPSPTMRITSPSQSRGLTPLYQSPSLHSASALGPAHVISPRAPPHTPPQSPSSTVPTPLLPPFSDANSKTIPSPFLPRSFDSQSQGSSTPSTSYLRKPTPSQLGNWSPSSVRSQPLSQAEDVQDDVFRLSSPPTSSQLSAKTTPPQSQQERSANRALGTPTNLTRESSRAEFSTPPHEEIGPPNGAVEEESAETVLPGLGITVSPVKGRRLRLVRPSSPSPGRSTVGSSESRGSHTSPRQLAAGRAMSRLTMQWLDSSPTSPHEQSESSALQKDQADIEERELKKRKRLAAFEDPSPSKKSPLKPTEVDGMGRLALNPKDFYEETLMTTKRKGRKRGASLTPVKRVTVFGLEVKSDVAMSPPTVTPPMLEGEAPHWPDSEFPWNETGKEWEQEEKLMRSDKLRWVEKFLDRETDEEEPEDSAIMNEPGIPSPGDDLTSHPGPSRRIHASGKSVRSTAMFRRALPSNDPADARSALLAKRPKRPTRRTNMDIDGGGDSSSSVSYSDGDGQESDDPDEGIISCVCGEGDDGRAMVRCDGCRAWSHLHCVDIHDESELGAEWFCARCIARSHEPTFAPTSESPRERLNPSVRFYQPPPFPPESPTPYLPRLTNAPSTPMRAPRTRVASWGHDAADQTNGITLPGPVTPSVQRNLDQRVYSTPKFFDDSDHVDYRAQASFDPLSTPSKGLKFAIPLGSAARNTLGPPSTPANHSRPQHSSSLSLSATRPALIYSSGTATESPGPASPTTRRSLIDFKPDETPIRYTAKRQLPLFTPKHGPALLSSKEAKGKERESSRGESAAGGDDEMVEDLHE